MIFVFGSNLAGVHGAGAARVAHQKHGAIWGQGKGMAGNSYAIPTKDGKIVSLPLKSIQFYVGEFLIHAIKNPQSQFQVTCIGCGLAGFQHYEIAPMFVNAPENCYFDTEWKLWLPEKKFWGSFTR
jgi:hypothetical protein